MEFTIFVGAGILFGALVAALWVIFQQDSRIRNLKANYRELFDDYNQLEREYDLLKCERGWEYDLLKRENGWLEEERERLLKENDELEDRCIELSKSAAIEELFEGAKEKLDEYVQKIARKE